MKLSTTKKKFGLNLKILKPYIFPAKPEQIKFACLKFFTFLLLITHHIHLKTGKDLFTLFNETLLFVVILRKPHLLTSIFKILIPEFSRTLNLFIPASRNN